MNGPMFYLYAVEFGNSFGGMTLALDQDDAKFNAAAASGFLDQGDYIANVPGKTEVNSREMITKLHMSKLENSSIPSNIRFLPNLMCSTYRAKVGEHWCFENLNSKLEFIILPTIEDVHLDLNTCQINERDLWFCSDWSEDTN